MKNTFALLLFLSLPLSAQEKLIPDTWFQDITASDGSTQQSIIFTTVPGVEYTFQHSNDLSTWTEVGETYGLGQQFAAAMRETAPAPAPPPADPQNPPAPFVLPIPASLIIQPSSAVEGGTVVSWPSLDHGNSVQYLITGTMGTGWNNVPMFAQHYGTHYFFISHPTGTTTPPATPPFLDEKDAAMIADLEAAWTTFNASVANTTAIARNSPPPPPPSPDAIGFWRVSADWSLDSDSDGITDAAEFAYAANETDTGQLKGNALNGDTNTNGIPDGEEIDTDGDGVMDAFDLLASDGSIAYSRLPLPRYAVFPIAGYGSQINDRGTVLLDNDDEQDRAVWKNGKKIILKRHPVYGGVSSYHSLDDKDRVLGWIDYPAPDADPDSSDIRTTALVWTSPTDVPTQPLATIGNHSIRPGSGFGIPLTSNQLFSGGSFLAGQHYEDDKFFDGGVARPALAQSLWTVDPAGAFTLAPAADPNAWFHDGGGVSWGFHGDQNNNTFQLYSPFQTTIPLGEPYNLVGKNLPDDTPTILATSKIEDSVFWDGTAWTQNKTLANALDISADGIAIGKTHIESRRKPNGTVEEIQHANPVLLNWQWTSFDRIAPGLPAAWVGGATLKDTSPKGWILAEGPSSAAMLPIRFKGRYTLSDDTVAERAVGVDDFSIGSSEPDYRAPVEPGEPVLPPAVKDRIWIMAPLGGGAKTVVVNAPVSASAPLKISSVAGITFDGQPEFTLAESGQSFELLAVAPTSTGEEHPADMTMGEGNDETTSVSQPLWFKMMKPRTVNVTVYKIADDLLTGDEAGIIDADLVPTKQQLENRLNDIFKPQVNITFNVVIKETQVETPVDHDLNGKFDYNVDDHSLNQRSIALDAIDQAGAASADTSITLYLLGTSKQIGKPGTLGTANPTMRTCWAKAKNVNTAREDEEMAELLTTIIHEIGHIMIARPSQ